MLFSMKDKVFESKLKEMLEYYEMAEDERRLELRIYKIRWIWYHTILTVGLGFVVYLLFEINNKIGALI